MIIMLEGLDRTGKTTLASALADVMDAPVIHRGAPTAADALTEYLAPLAGYGLTSNLVLDRWHWGEMVWPAIFGRDSLMGEREFRYVDRALANLGAVAVYCTGKPYDIWKRMVADDEPLTTFHNGVGLFHIAHNGFEVVSQLTAMPVIRYDFAEWSLDEAVAGIVASARGNQRLLAAMREGD